MSDSIYLRDLNVDCIIGINPHERYSTQRLIVQVELKLNVDDAATLDRFELTVDYESISSQILFLLHLGQFRLLETACLSVCRALLLPPNQGERRAAVEAVKVRIDKPEGLMGQGLPGVEMTRRQSDASYEIRQTSYGHLHVVHETPELGICRKSIAAGQVVPLHLHRQHQEAEMLISDGISTQDVLGAIGSIHLWPISYPHGYGNFTDVTQSVLCISRPACMLIDEILAEGRSAPVGVMTSRDLDAKRIAHAWTLEH